MWYKELNEKQQGVVLVQINATSQRVQTFRIYQGGLSTAGTRMCVFYPSLVQLELFMTSLNAHVSLSQVNKFINQTSVCPSGVLETKSESKKVLVGHDGSLEPC